MFFQLFWQLIEKIDCSIITVLRSILIHSMKSKYFFFNFLKKFNYIWFTMFCLLLLYSKVTWSYIYIHYFSHTIFHHVPSQVIGYSSLYYTAGSHCLSTPNAMVRIYQPQTPSLSYSLPFPLGNHKSVLYVHEFVSVL